MIEGVPVGDAEGQDASASKLKLLGVAISMVAIMLLVSINGWIIDDVVDEIKKDLGIYERVPVWERSEWPYITSGSYSYVMEMGDYGILQTDNDWNSEHHFVSFDLPPERGRVRSERSGESGCVAPRCAARRQGPRDRGVRALLRRGQCRNSIDRGSRNLAGTDDNRPDPSTWIRIRSGVRNGDR